jgi:hypothetical protein
MVFQNDRPAGAAGKALNCRVVKLRSSEELLFGPYVNAAAREKQEF